MTDTSNDIRQMLPLLKMVYQAEQLKMAKITARIRDLRHQLTALERPRAMPEDNLSAATLAGADLLWESWVQERKILINQELAIASRDREQAKSGLIQALAKLEAAKQIQGRAKIDAERTKERRSSW